MKTSFPLLLVLLVAACSPTRTSEEANTSEPKKTNVLGEEMTYAADGVTMKGYLAVDTNDETKRPGVLVVHEWWGHNAYARQRAEMLAELGYVALAVDMYGDGKLAKHPSEAGEFSSMVMGNFEGAKVRFESAMKTLQAHPNVDAEKIGAIGYCFGGSVVLSMANAGFDLDAVASFHGGLGLPVMPEEGAVKAKVLVANGAADKFISAEQIADYKAAMDAAGASYTFINYEGALHSFTSKAADQLAEEFGMNIGYNAAADSASWEEMKAVFERAF